MNRSLPLLAALLVVSFASAKPPELPVVKEIVPPTASQGLVVLAVAKNDQNVSDGLVVEAIAAGGTPARFTLHHERGEPRASAMRVLGGALAPGKYRVVGWAAIQNIGTPSKKELVELPLPIEFIEPGMAEFEVRAGGVTDLGAVYPMTHNGFTRVLLRAPQSARTLPYSETSAVLALARANASPSLGWTQPLSAQESAELARERALITQLVALRQDDRGRWWTAGGYGRVLRRTTEGAWTAFRIPGDPQATVIEAIPGGGAVIGGVNGAVAVVRDDRVETRPVQGLEPTPVLAAACAASGACVVVQGRERQAGKPGKEISEFTLVAFRHVPGEAAWVPVDSITIEPYLGRPIGEADVDGYGGKIYLVDLDDEVLHRIDAESGKVDLIESSHFYEPISANGGFLATQHRFSLDGGVTWTKTVTANQPPYLVNANGWVVARDYDAQGYASNRVETLRISTDNGDRFGAEHEIPSGFLSLGVSTNELGVVEFPGGYDWVPGIVGVAPSGFQLMVPPMFARPSIIYWSNDGGATWTVDERLYEAVAIPGGAP